MVFPPGEDLQGRPSHNHNGNKKIGVVETVVWKTVFLSPAENRWFWRELAKILIVHSTHKTRKGFCSSYPWNLWKWRVSPRQNYRLPTAPFWQSRKRHCIWCRIKIVENTILRCLGLKCIGWRLARSKSSFQQQIYDLCSTPTPKSAAFRSESGREKQILSTETWLSLHKESLAIEEFFLRPGSP